MGFLEGSLPCLQSGANEDNLSAGFQLNPVAQSSQDLHHLFVPAPARRHFSIVTVAYCLPDLFALSPSGAKIRGRPPAFTGGMFPRTIQGKGLAGKSLRRRLSYV